MKKSLQQLISLCMVLAVLLGLSVSASAAPFSDVPAGADYAEAVQWAADHGYVNGYSDGRFGVNDNVTRAQLAAILYRAAGEPAASGTTRFSDVSSTAYYANAASWAADSGLVNGYADGRFGTGDSVTRQQVAAILWRWAGSPAASAGDYADESAIASYAGTAVDWSRANSIMDARSDGRFDPAAPATRAEIVSALYHYMGSASVPAGNSKVLVAYFSASGSTEAVAEAIAEALNADLFQLVPTDPYTSEDLNWTASGSRVSQEHEDPARQNVELEESTTDSWADYGTVFIGYPIWWGEAAWPVNNFVRYNDFTGKTVIPFCTSASSGLGQSGQLLEEMAGNGNWLEGRRFPSHAEKAEIANWVDSLPILE